MWYTFQRDPYLLYNYIPTRSKMLKMIHPNTNGHIK